MNNFKFFRNNKIKSDWIQRSWFPQRHRGRLNWIYRDVGTLFYMEARMDNGFYEEEVKYTTVTICSRYINSYNHFMEMHRNKVIFVYEFIDNTNISNMIHYNEDNFNDMPKDRPIIFRGLIRSHEVF